MQAIMETLFDIVYLFTVTAIGITMIKKSKGNKQYLLFGIMAVVLGCGDAFHLVPRAYALCTTGLENPRRCTWFRKIHNIYNYDSFLRYTISYFFNEI